MKKILIAICLCVALSACGKYGPGGKLNRAFGNWAELNLPEGCKVRQIAGEETSGVIVLCEDGRVFH